MESVQELLDKYKFEYNIVERPSGDYALMCCPFCKDDKEPSFAINLEHGGYKCYRENNCGVTGNFYQFKKHIENKPIDIESVKRYMIENRKLTLETLRKFQCKINNGAVLFPFFVNGELVNTKYRKISDKKFWSTKNGKEHLFNQDNAIDKILVITESEIDCMSFDQYGVKNVVSLPFGASLGKWVNNDKDFLSKFTKIFICTDNDIAGNKVAIEISNILSEHECFRVTLPFKDANECLQNNVSVDEIKECFRNATTIESSLEELYCAPDNDDLERIANEDTSIKGLQTTWKKFNKITNGIRMGEYTILSGNSHTGKTTMALQLAVDMAKHHNMGVGIFSLEMGTFKAKKWMILQATNGSKVCTEKEKPLFVGKNSSIQFSACDTAIDEDFLVENIEFWVKHKKTKLIIIDSLDYIDLKFNNSEYMQQRFFARRLETLARTLNIHIILITHNRKPPSGVKEYKSTMYDVAGSKSIVTPAYNVFVLNREEGRLLLNIAKNRESGQVGEIAFYIDYDSKKFYEI